MKLPENWNILNLEDLTEVITKGTTPTTLGFQYIEEGINFIKVESISNSGNFKHALFAHISAEANSVLKRSVILEFDILYSIAGALGRVAIADKTILPANTNQALSIIRLKDKSYVKYIYYYLNSDIIKKHIDRINVQNAQANLSLLNIRNFKIPLPPLEEQKKIADILSTVDQKIDLIDTQINDTGVLKKGLMQKLLTQGIRHSKFKESEIGRIPAGWEVQQLGDLTSLTAGGTPSTTIKEYWTPKEIPWLSSGEVNKKIVHDTDNMISENGLKNSAAKLVPKNSILIALAGQGKTRGTVAITEIELTTNQSVASILPSEKLEMYFIYHNLNARYEELRSMSTGAGGRGGLNLAILKSVKIALPPLEEQKQISQILSTTDEKLSSLREKKEAYETLKKGLMQKLLTGEVRVK